MQQTNNATPPDDGIITMVSVSDAGKINRKKQLSLITSSVVIAVLVIWQGLAMLHGTSLWDLRNCIFDNKERDQVGCVGNFLTQSLGIGTTIKTSDGKTITITPNKGAIPDYPLSFALHIPDGVKTSFLEDFKTAGAKNVDMSVTEIPGSIDGVKSFYTEGLAKNGWSNASTQIPKEFSDLVIKGGGFSASYIFGNKEILLFALPGTVAINGNVPIKSELDVILYIISGES